MSTPKKHYLQLKKSAPFSLQVSQWNTKTNEFSINGVVFVDFKSNKNKSDPGKDRGYLISGGDLKIKDLLQKRNISYLTEDGELYLVGHDRILHSVPFKKSRAHRSEVLTNSVLSATSALSPLGMQIVEVFLRLPLRRVKEYKSTLAICKDYGLHQPKVSSLMKSIGAKDPLSFKEKLSSIPYSWWEFAFETPTVRRHLVPFNSVAQEYHSPVGTNSIADLRSQLKVLIGKEPSSVAWGPSELATQRGLLISNSLSLWCGKEYLNALKKKFKLISGKDKRPNGVTWLIADVGDFYSNAILLPKSTQVSTQSILRAAWDLTFADERSREIRPQLMSELKNEV